MFGTRTFKISVLARKVRPTGVGRGATWNGGSGSASRLIQPGGRREINKGKKEPLRGGRAGVGEEGGNNLGDTCAVGSLPGSLQQGKEVRTSMSRWERGQGGYLRQRNMYGNTNQVRKQSRWRCDGRRPRMQVEVERWIFWYNKPQKYGG